MQLYHFDKAPNFGDALNPWLWPQLLGHRLKTKDSTIFLGIGTIIKTGLPPAESYVVLGTGGGYGSFPKIDDSWRIYAVRGPLTARALGIDPRMAALDGAYLLRNVPLPSPAAAGPRIGFMPHWETRLRVPWKRICENSGLRYLDPLLPVTDVLAQMRACDGIIAEAMHGAITADALRIPWVAVRIGDQFLDFKWRDWLGSVNLTFNPVRLPTIRPYIAQKEPEGFLTRNTRRAINGGGYLWQARTLANALSELRSRFEANRNFGCLSHAQTLDARFDRLERGLDRVREVES
jgi:succinoglycan biosynthesis protein ExoV